MKSRRGGKRQFGTVGIRLDADLGMQVLLITSRGTGRWVIPKGWPMRGRTALEAAMTEAYEEAGVVGTPLVSEPVGSYRYRKVLRSGLEAELRVSVFAVLVTGLLDDWPERAERSVQWFSPVEAAASVAEPALAKLLRRLPRTLGPVVDQRVEA